MSKNEIKVAKEIRKANDQVYAEVERIRRELEARIKMHSGRISIIVNREGKTMGLKKR